MLHRQLLRGTPRGSPLYVPCLCNSAGPLSNVETEAFSRRRLLRKHTDGCRRRSLFRRCEETETFSTTRQLMLLPSVSATLFLPRVSLPSFRTAACFQRFACPREVQLTAAGVASTALPCGHECPSGADASIEHQKRWKTYYDEVRFADGSTEKWLGPPNLTAAMLGAVSVSGVSVTGDTTAKMLCIVSLREI